MKHPNGQWWSGFIVGGSVMWIVAAALLSIYARGSAMIPFAEPMRSHFETEANAVALRIFAIAASPGALALFVFGLWRGLSKR